MGSYNQSSNPPNTRGDVLGKSGISAAFGQRALQHFDFDPEYRNLNHASFGASPSAIRKKLCQFQDLAEAMPDQFIRYQAPDFLNESREAVAELLNAPTDTVVLVPNASVGVNTVLRNITWNEDSKDEILYFSTIYGACGKTIDYMVDSSQNRVSAREIRLRYPLEDDEVIAALRDAIEASAKSMKRTRVCLFDTVSSLPSVRLPFERITEICREAGILSLIDGAQGVGMIDIDLKALDPDFFVSNCHKWLYVPRSCAVLYVPLRNQAIITSSLPTSHGYIPKSETGRRFNPMPKQNKSAFINNFQFVGTLDTSAYLCVKDAIEWRRRILGGEPRIIEYTQTLAREGGKKVASILGTDVLDNKSASMSRCATTNVALPLRPGEAARAPEWMMETMISDYKTFIPLFSHSGRLWARISAQVYLDIQDFEWAGRMLLELCERVGKGEDIGWEHEHLRKWIPIMGQIPL
ncbi:PLP-dependent transferase [Annulohypoxylon maeteangense]|uniref:PLP-dependent transferase n=1 Tax=Annulohypoxylon maeteangense TaxID=1927788 RepID=UPI0020082830|nr:PLP-dependent transferase [Annulohypoxylon maeteangense]KAI0880536.1 PLP-dependent transferase [Annulohypoxylon maeteangense]